MLNLRTGQLPILRPEYSAGGWGDTESQTGVVARATTPSSSKRPLKTLSHEATDTALGMIQCLTNSQYSTSVSLADKL
jgi:hypothetical protein